MSQLVSLGSCACTVFRRPQAASLQQYHLCVPELDKVHGCSVRTRSQASTRSSAHILTPLVQGHDKRTDTPPPFSTHITGDVACVQGQRQKVALCRAHWHRVCSPFSTHDWHVQGQLQKVALGRAHRRWSWSQLCPQLACCPRPLAWYQLLLACLCLNQETSPPPAAGATWRMGSPAGAPSLRNSWLPLGEGLVSTHTAKTRPFTEFVHVFSYRILVYFVLEKNELRYASMCMSVVLPISRSSNSTVSAASVCLLSASNTCHSIHAIPCSVWPKNNRMCLYTSTDSSRLRL